MNTKLCFLLILPLTLIVWSCRNNDQINANTGNTEKNNSADTGVWTADNGDGTYRNPIIYADYSDPDVIRAGGKFYMTASSFNCVPGLPILESTDLVNWKLIGYALKELVPNDYFANVRHGGGVWAPCMRFHNGQFYIYYPDPDFGIYMIRTKDPAGEWSDPVLVKEGKGFIDPSPLWDEDGRAYLVYAFAGSRAGVKSVLIVSPMNQQGTHVEDEGVMIFDGHDDNPTVEGPKFYKRHGYYYIFAPAGGVTPGWQLVMRSENIFGPYEVKKVLHQGNTDINGPHQGAWVTTQTGEDWFIHFQDKGAYGRIVHLQPLKWVDNWPVIGVDINGDGIGEPVTSFKKPETGLQHQPATPPENDEFNGNKPGLQWQWHANPTVKWGYMSGNQGFYRLNCIPKPEGYTNLWDVPNILMQKFPAEEFTATSCITFNLRSDGEEAGLVVMGRDYQYMSLIRQEGKLILKTARCLGADKKGEEATLQTTDAPSGKLYFRIRVDKDALCSFSYSTDGSTFKDLGESFSAAPGMWIGAKIGFFALREGFLNDCGTIDIDWFRISKNR